MSKSAAWYLLAWLLASCAQVREPQGGDRDSAPPALVIADPPANSTHFSATRIVLTFNERIRLDRVRERLIVSPPLTAPPDVRQLGANSVLIKLGAALDSNTTYTFNIGDAVLDLSENNPASGLTYVVSTGAHIDSLQLLGAVFNAFSALPEKEVLVLLYPAVAGDSLFRNGSPSYFTRSKADGGFALMHLRPGRYALYALRDKNLNYRYDLPNEEIAFFAGTIDLVAGDSALHNLHLFLEPAAELRVLEARVIPDRALRIITTRAVEQPDLIPIAWSGGELKWSLELNPTRDSLLFWPSDTTALAGRIFVFRDDTMVIDTVRYVPMEKMPFNIDAQLVRRSVEGGIEFRLRTNRPVEEVDLARIKLYQDTTQIPVQLGPDPLHLRSLKILADLAERPAQLELLPGALADGYGARNDTLRFDLGSDTPGGSGTLKIVLDLRAHATPGTLRLQLLNGQGGVVRESDLAAEKDPLKWNTVPAGAYVLKLLADKNGNGHWDPGSLSANLPPERVWRYEGMVNVRADWDVEVIWTVP